MSPRGDISLWPRLITVPTVLLSSGFYELVLTLEPDGLTPIPASPFTERVTFG